MVSPADQVIHNVDQFKRAIAQAVELAQSDNIVILGVPPNSPETGYGYINIGDNKNENNLSFTVKSFHEKPNSDLAEST